jgi:uncharacterized RDD family membrane protein YckC
MMYASWGRRLLGYGLDVLVVLVATIVAAYVLDALVPMNSSVPEAVGWSLSSIAGLAVWGYNRWFLTGRTGQTWGRRALGIRLVGADGRPVGAGRALARDLAHILDGLPLYVGWLFPLWDAKRQTFADKVMNTVVVRG